MAHSYQCCSAPFLDTVGMQAWIACWEGASRWVRRAEGGENADSPRASVLGSDPSTCLPNTTQIAVLSEENPSSCLGALDPCSLCTANPTHLAHIWGLSHCSSCLSSDSCSQESALSKGVDGCPVIQGESWSSWLDCSSVENASVEGMGFLRGVCRGTSLLSEAPWWLPFRVRVLSCLSSRTPSTPLQR